MPSPLAVISTFLALWLSLGAATGSAFSQTVFAERVNLQRADAKTRMTIAVTGPVSPRHFLLENPNRLVVDLPGLVFSEDAPVDAPLGVVRSLRTGKITDSHSRLIITLDTPSIVDSVDITPDSQRSGAAIITIDLRAVNAGIYTRTLARERLSQNSTTDLAYKGDRTRPPRNDNQNTFIVVIDPGHGGIDGGATDARGRVVEKNITLSVARRLQRLAAGLNNTEVFLTRDSDRFLTLSERVRFARSRQADLFVSIHADSLSQKDVRGATIYTLSRKATDEVSAALAARENRADLVAGLELTEESEGVADILIDLARLETKGFSRKFADTLLQTMRGRVRLINNPKRGAGFRVLKAPDVTSVLVELGYLSNPQDAILLAKPDWQDAMAKVLLDAIDAFRADLAAN